MSCSSEKHVKRTQQRQTKGGRGKNVPRPTAAAPVSIRSNTARSGADTSRFLSPPSTPAERNTQRVGTKPSGGRSPARAHSAPRSPGQELWPGRWRREERCGGSEARPPSPSPPHAAKRREGGHAALTHGRLTARPSLASQAAAPTCGQDPAVPGQAGPPSTVRGAEGGRAAASGLGSAGAPELPAASAPVTAGPPGEGSKCPQQARGLPGPLVYTHTAPFSFSLPFRFHARRLNAEVFPPGAEISRGLQLQEPL